MNILRTYKRTQFFLWVNIIGLAIGLAVSMMLTLFVINELSYDKHFANNERIIRLNSVIEESGQTTHYPINLRKAYTEIPEKVSGIENTVQLYRAWEVEVVYEKKQFQALNMLYVDTEFFKVFQMKFVEGTPENALEGPHTLVITRPHAEKIFGTAKDAIYKTVTIDDQEYTVTAIVEAMPANTHFSFDVLTNTYSFPWIEWMQGLEFFTYYLIKENVSLEQAREEIEKEYSSLMEPFGIQFNAKAYGETDKLTDIYLHSKSDFGLGKSNDMKSIWILIILAVLIMLLAVTNFINLFMAQGESRMSEIGIRKTNGARIEDIIKQFFSEVTLTVIIAFALGFFLAVVLTPYFSTLIDKQIDLIQVLNPVFILCIIALLIITVLLTASYPSFYLSRFNALDVLEKRVKFSKRRLTSIVVIFQSVITIVLISYILVINHQTTYLENIPKGYNSENVITYMLNNKTIDSYQAIKQELLKIPNVEKVSGGQHVFGLGCSGQGIALLENKEHGYSINEYRILPDMCELMELRLVEGEFFKEDQPKSLPKLILNESAIKMLGLEYPVVGKEVGYKGISEIIGVVKDFIYDEPADKIQPLALYSSGVSANVITIKFNRTVSRTSAEQLALNTMHLFDSDFVLNPLWSDDIYKKKFDGMKTQSRIIFAASLLSLFISMLGLIAIHLYASLRRTKEIGIRRVNGATCESIFKMLSFEIVKWILIAGVIAIPIAYYITSNWLNNYTNHVTLNWMLPVIPVLVQCLIAILTTSGVSWYVLSRNPVEALKKE